MVVQFVVGFVFKLVDNVKFGVFVFGLDDSDVQVLKNFFN